MFWSWSIPRYVSTLNSTFCVLVTAFTPRESSRTCCMVNVYIPTPTYITFYIGRASQLEREILSGEFGEFRARATRSDHCTISSLTPGCKYQCLMEMQ
ncbi:uncharacterized protein F4822DRAFT_405489 [Hypoxylon trugodes]|uniref:uncharacterized protein n=1 Tax=Hypoxylon trugodes TaxID=326681 RepID=UPI002197F3BE|nr:uncharacterized protein F4822DRAFT_405489 [Hypoxylon trugodes]KAI1387114.1 hypothetical protein F4822DRAFT_405489 [Hypoxylon trugodes]